MDIDRLIKLCGLLVGLWVVQVVGLGQFRSGMAAKPPRYHVVDFEAELGRMDPGRPFVEIAKERGWDASAPLVSEDGARELEQKHRQKRWVAYAGLFVALAAVFGIVFTGRRIWDSWPLGLAVVFFGPVAVAWGMNRLRVSSQGNP